MAKTKGNGDHLEVPRVNLPTPPPYIFLLQHGPYPVCQKEGREADGVEAVLRYE